MKVGLVLEGGAMRGMYTAAILDMLLKRGIHVDGVVGVSAGALFGVNLLSRQAGRALRYNKRFVTDKRYIGYYPLFHEGNVISTAFAYGEVPRVLDPFDDETYRAAVASGVPFYAVVTNMKTGEAEYKLIDSVFDKMDTLRASGSMPFVSRPVIIDGTPYLDGAIADSIPFRFMADMGYNKLIVVLTRDKSYRKKPMSKPLSFLRYRGYPAFYQGLLSRHEMYNESTEALLQWEKEGRAFVFRPSSPIQMKRVEKNPDKLQEAYDLGVRDAENRLPSLLSYLAE